LIEQFHLNGIILEEKWIKNQVNEIVKNYLDILRSQEYNRTHWPVFEKIHLVNLIFIVDNVFEYLKLKFISGS